MLDNARRAYARLTLAPLPAEGSLTVVATPEEAVDGADFVQESAPEREELKRELLAAASRAAGPDVLFASLDLRPAAVAPAGRTCCIPSGSSSAHPFNPVYLLPLVEVCGGAPPRRASAPPRSTARSACARWCCAARSTASSPTGCSRRCGARRCGSSHDDVATVERDRRRDPLRRRPALGVHGHLPDLPASPAARHGMRHFIEQFGPTLQLPWTKLIDVPELDDELLDKLVAQSDAQAAGRSIRELERAARRLPGGDHPGPARAGRRRRRGARRVRARPARRATPRTTTVARCTPRACCRSGSTTTATCTRAATCRCSATRPTRCCATLGVDVCAAAATSRSRPTSRTCSEATRGRARARHDAAARPRREAPAPLPRAPRGDDALLATAEQMLLHVDASTRRAAPAPPEVLERVAADRRRATRGLPRPERAGRAIGMCGDELRRLLADRARLRARRAAARRARTTTRPRSTRASWSSGRPRSGSRATTCRPSTAAAASRAWSTSCA